MTAKQRFQQDKHVSDAHFNYVASDNFRKAVEASLVEMLYKVQGAKGGDDAAVAARKLDGAMEFLGIFKTLADVGKEFKEKASFSSLDHKV